MTDQPGQVRTEMQSAMQASLWGCQPLACGPIDRQPERLDASSWVLFQPRWLVGSDAVFEQLRCEMPWRAVQRPMYDRIVDVPRLICSIEPEALGREHPLTAVTRELQAALGTPFRHIGLNYYRTGEDSVAWHRDRVGRDRHASTVVLVSLGSPRSFQLRSYPRAQRLQRRSWRLGGGDLLIMSGACQRDWEHGVPKESNVGPRISIAFRTREPIEGPPSLYAEVPPLGLRHKLQ